MLGRVREKQKRAKFDESVDRREGRVRRIARSACLFKDGNRETRAEELPLRQFIDLFNPGDIKLHSTGPARSRGVFNQQPRLSKSNNKK